MKISSASKKVLASALSAAMVVAFAPTVALAAPAAGDAAKVHFVTATGANATSTDSTTAPKDQNILLVNDSGTIKTGDITVSDDAYKYYGAAISGWFYDADKDGVYTPTTVDPNSKDLMLTYTEVAGDDTITSFAPASTFKDGDTINLVAVYNLAAFGAVGNVVDQDAQDGDVLFTLPMTNIPAGDYKLTVKKGTEALVDAKTITGAAITAATKTITVKASTATTGATAAGKVAADVAYIDAAKYGAGEYTFTLEDENGYVVSATAKISTLTFANGGDAGVLINDGAKTYTVIAANGKKLSDAENASALTAIGNTTATRADGKNNGTAPSCEWTFADGSALTSAKITADATLIPVLNVAKVSALSFDNVGGKMVLTYATSATPNTAAKGAPSGVKSYDVTIAGPAGTLASMTLDKESTAFTGGNITLGDTANTGSVFTATAQSTAQPAAGTYTVTVKQNNIDGTSATYTKSTELVTVTYDLAGGKWNDARMLEKLPSLVEKGDSLDDAFIKDTSLTGTTSLDPANDDATKGFKKWSVSGLKNAGGNAVTEIAKGTTKAALIGTGTYTATGTVTLTAVWEDQNAAAPAVSFAGTTVTVTPAEGTTVQYRIGGAGAWTTYSTPVTLKSTDKVFEVQSSKSGLTSTTVEYTRYDVAIDLDGSGTTVGDTAPQAEVKALANAYGIKANATNTNYIANDEAYKAAVAAIDAKITATGFATLKDWKKVVAAEEGEVVAAYAAAVKAGLAEYNAGYVKADGSADKIADSIYTDTCAKIDKVVAAWALNHDTDTTNNVTINNVAGANAVANDYVADIDTAKNAAVAAKVSYKKADVDAAAAVSAQLKDPKTAAAGLEAYAALTAAQKDLVSAADLAAAEAAVAAVELKDAQDDAAVSKARNASKTVKAGKNGKTTKKQSVTLKAITSKSGAKVTYKKTSGKKAITVKSGKAYLAKGVKKGTYKATVKATCGTQTAKITVKFVVK